MSYSQEPRTNFWFLLPGFSYYRFIRIDEFCLLILLVDFAMCNWVWWLLGNWKLNTRNIHKAGTIHSPAYPHSLTWYLLFDIQLNNGKSIRLLSLSLLPKKLNQFPGCRRAVWKNTCVSKREILGLFRRSLKMKRTVDKKILKISSRKRRKIY